MTLPHSAVQLGILGFVALVASFVRQRPIRNLPSVLIKLLAAGFISFVLAWLALFVTSSFILYIPSRHTHAVLFLSLVIYISVNIPETVRATALWLRPYRNRSVAVVAPAVILALLAFLLSPLQAEYYREVSWMPLARWSLPGLVVTLVTLSYQSATKRDDEELIWSRGNCEAPERLGRIILATGFLALSLYYVTVMSRSAYRPSGDARPLFSYVNTLPTDALLAGDPCTLDSVPLYGRRSVLFNCDRHGHLSREAIRDALSAYYAAEWDEVYAFCERYGVSHLVVNAESYTDDVVKNRGYFFEPYASQVGDIIRSRPRYILAGTPVENRLFEAGDFYVVACQDGEQAID